MFFMLQNVPSGKFNLRSARDDNVKPRMTKGHYLFKTIKQSENLK